MQYSVEELISITLKECRLHKLKLSFLFVLISVSLLTVGTVWPKRYTTASTIYVDARNIIQPLMQGTAVTTESHNHAENAREIILGSNILGQVLEAAGWLKESPTPIEIDNIQEEIKKRTEISNIGKNLIRIQYKDSDPLRAFITVKQMTALFVDEGKESKIEESRAAYEFIEKQAQAYLDKLTTADQQLKELLVDNPDARAGSQTEITQRISSLRSRIETTTLELREAEIRKESLQLQVSGEAAITISQSKEGQYIARINNLKTELETLLLTYTETYPDVVRIRHQIGDLVAAMESEVKQRGKAVAQAKKEGNTYHDQSIASNPLYQSLRTSLSDTETTIVTLETRIREMNIMLKKEHKRYSRLQESEALMQRLTRDYEVNQEIYTDLLRRRENARVSRSLDTEQHGLSFKVQEKPVIPVRPNGIRFMHFAILGIILGVGVPVAIIYGIIQIDPRIRSSRVITDSLDFPVLTEIPRYYTRKEIRHESYSNITVSIVFVAVIVLYGYVSWLKLTGEL